jgi:hypothetical protein
VAYPKVKMKSKAGQIPLRDVELKEEEEMTDVKPLL